jgi:pimeloyl-ACP methyl ester carboxylesterase
LSQHSGRARAIDVGDGFVLTVEISGAANGWPVVLIHGTPGSRTGPKPRGSVLSRLGVKLICYDRPGYGDSTRRPGRRVVDAAADVAGIADHLGLTRFSVVGRSGGGPHALACAAQLPDRVHRVAALVCVAPANAEGLDWFGGMTNDNVEAYSTADRNTTLLMERLRARAENTFQDPMTLIEVLRTEMSPADLRVVRDVPIRSSLVHSYREGLKGGPDGWIDDVLALREPWGFELGSIRVPVRLWHGIEDTFTPASHTRWLASMIPDAIHEVQVGQAHFGAVEVLPDLLSWLVAEAEPEPVPEPELEGVRVEHPVQVPVLAER